MARKLKCECGGCPTCRSREWHRHNRDASRKNALDYRRRNIESVRIKDRARGNRTPLEQQRASWAVKHELEMGRLERPSACSECGASPPPAIDGRSQVEAHHDDYSKPLEVIWLCHPCHMKRHRQVAA